MEAYELKDLETLLHIDKIQLRQEIKNKIEKCNLLICGKLAGKETKGSFDDELWLMENKLTQTIIVFDFAALYKFDKHIDEWTVEDTLKLWLAESYLADRRKSSKSLKEAFEVLVEFIKATNNFSIDFIDTTTGDKIKDLFDDMDISDTSKNIKISRIKEYINYLNRGLGINNKKYSQYYILLEELAHQYPKIVKHRALPESKDIIMFCYAIDKFFKDCENKNLKLLFTPILIWWKLTNIIPMRPTEVTTKLVRECIEEERGKYFLKVGRVKLPKSLNVSKSLPILERIEINQEIAILMKDYIINTNEYGHTDTFFSYSAHKELIRQLYIDEKLLNGQRSNNRIKDDEDKFSSTILSALLRSFYELVIKEYCGISTELTQIKLGDTRHFAFFSLLLQGLSPVEIALLGGHSTIKPQEHYQQGIKYYVDSQLYELVSKRMVNKIEPSITSLKNVNEIWENMLEKTDEDIKTFRPLEIGWCTSRFEKVEDWCEDFETCIYCSKWWIEKTDSNYIELHKHLKENILQKANRKLELDVEFIKTLLDNISLNKVYGDTTIDRKQWNKIRTVASKIKSDCEEVAKIKYTLIDFSDTQNCLNSIANDLIEIEKGIQTEEYKDEE